MVEEEESIFVDDYYDDVNAFRNTEEGSESAEHEHEPELDTSTTVAAKAPSADATLVEEVVLNTPLIFQQQIIKELVSNDLLLIMARGLGFLNITAHLLHILDVGSTEIDANSNILPGGGTILLLGTNEQTTSQIAELMRTIALNSKNKRHRGLTAITSENSYTVEKRGRMYKEGGIFAISMRQLLADMLSYNLKADQITSLVLLNPENLVNNANTQFILRLFRKSNKSASIKAISEAPERFLGEFNFQTYLNNLMVRRVMMWPRFHFQVIEDFKSISTSEHNKVIEIAVTMSESMKIIQTVLIDVIISLTAGIRRMNRKYIDFEVTIESALERKFSGLISAALGRHRVSLETRSKRHDLAAVEDLLEKLPSLDPVSFYEQITMLRSDNSGGPEAPPYPVWLDEPNGETLRTTARLRAGLSPGYKPEMQPKYQHLVHLLDEISMDKARSYNGPILILCKTLGASKDLRDYLSYLRKSGTNNPSVGGQRFLRHRIKQLKARREALKILTKHWKASVSSAASESQSPYNSGSHAGPSSRPTTHSAPSGGPNKRRRIRGGSTTMGSGITRSESAEYRSQREPDNDVPETIDVPDDSGDIISIGANGVQDEIPVGNFEILDPKDILIVRHYQDNLDDQLLEELQPSAVIMYEPSPSFLRALEVYLATHRPKNFRSYFMYYLESVEEGRYLHEIRREKDSFTKLIKEKSKLPEVYKDPAYDPESDPLGVGNFIRTVNTRVAGGGLKSFRGIGTSRIVFDVRELSSGKLPNALDKAGIEVVPIQLTVGDFILSPRICVERKSIKDMRDSFNDGRLYSQCVNMFRNYEMPLVLLEIDDFMDFKLDDPNAEILEEQFRKKLALLLLFFPKLYIAWSTSPEISAEIFLKLKYGFKEPEPDPVVAAQVGGVEKSESASANQQAIDTLLQLPGVNNGNYKDLLHKFKSIRDISKASKSMLRTVLGAQNGSELYNFFNTPYTGF